MIENNYWIGNIITPFLALFILGITFWFAREKDKIADSVKKKMTCDDSCHGSNDNYIYKDFFALEGVHDLEQRVAKLENSHDKFWLEKIKEFYDTFPNQGSIPDRRSWEQSEQYYLRLQKFNKWDKCKKCKKQWQETIEHLLKTDRSTIDIKQECICKEQERFKRLYDCEKCNKITESIIRQDCLCIERENNNIQYVMANSDFITHPDGENKITHDQYQQTDCKECLIILGQRIKELREKSEPTKIN